MNTYLRFKLRQHVPNKADESHSIGPLEVNDQSWNHLIDAIPDSFDFCVDSRCICPTETENVERERILIRNLN